LRPIEHATLPLSGSPGFAHASFVLVVVIGDACHACCTVISSHESMMENLLLRVPFLSLGTRIIHWCLTYFIHPLVRLCHRCYCLFYTFYHVCSTFSCHPSFVRECACVKEVVVIGAVWHGMCLRGRWRYVHPWLHTWHMARHIRGRFRRDGGCAYIGVLCFWGSLIFVAIVLDI